MKLIHGGFIIRAYGKEWRSPSFSYDMLQRAPDLPLSEEGIRQEGGYAWLPQNYREDFVKSHQKFPSDLIQDILPWLYKRTDRSFKTEFRWHDEQQSVVQSTLAACCLVSREWNRISTPVLFGDIFLGVKNPLLAQSLLHRTFRHTQPAHKALVKTMTIAPAEDGSTANLLSICFSMPNLRKIILHLT